MTTDIFKIHKLIMNKFEKKLSFKFFTPLRDNEFKCKEKLNKLKKIEKEFRRYKVKSKLLLNKYKKKLTVPFLYDFNKKEQNKYYHEYLYFASFYLQFPKKTIIKKNFCNNCFHTKTNLICENCKQNDEEKFSTTNTYLDKFRISITKKYNCDKLNSFIKHIKRFTGQQICKIDKKSLDIIRSLINGEVTIEKIQNVLKFKKFNEYYKDVFYIYKCLTGKDTKDISKIEKKIIEDYKEFYQMFSRIHPKKNINYKYIFNQLLIKNNITMNNLLMIKTNSRRLYHDTLYSKTFELLGWNQNKTY